MASNPEPTMKTRTPLGQALYDSIVAATAADDAFQAALVAQFGKRNAVARRYSYERADWGPALVAVHTLKTLAQEAQHAAFRALAAGGELP